MAVLFALARAEVRTLVVASGYARPGYRCAGSGRLVLTEEEAAGEAVIRVPDLVAHARAEAVRLGGQVVEVRESRPAARINGVAALLRHR